MLALLSAKLCLALIAGQTVRASFDLMYETLSGSGQHITNVSVHLHYGFLQTYKGLDESHYDSASIYSKGQRFKQFYMACSNE